KALYQIQGLLLLLFCLRDSWERKTLFFLPKSHAPPSAALELQLRQCNVYSRCEQMTFSVRAQTSSAPRSPRVGWTLLTERQRLMPHTDFLQGSCGACYAFSAIGAIEGQLVKAGKSLKSLSVQQIIDCSNKTWGCAGGFQTIVFKYAKDQVIVSNDVYPYSGKLNNQMSGVQVKSFKWVPNDEVKLAEAVGRIGPISINADSNHNSFFFTVEVTITRIKPDNTTYNHGMLLVGYGSEDGKDYWIVK
uniref:Peptidase C1A papain C-terminal domain-containing protein n=1 Tax=Callorhinchus milii TaxID=7868 RepID=A0A4W3GPV6_CALMI